jgi:hypothetical protein
MKTKILFLTLLSVTFFWMMSCDKIEAPYFRDTVAGDTSGIDTVSFNPALQTTRAVLLEEFTGHKCPNCPAASVIAHDLKVANPGKVVVVSIHSGVFATTDGAGDFTYDFRTTEGTIFDGFFKVADYGYPNALISRKKVDANKYVVAPQNWATKVDSLIDQASIASISINAYQVNGTDVKVYIRTQFLGSGTRQYKLGVILTEDSIVKPQKNNNSTVGPVPIIAEYQHRGVYRSSCNGTWGSAVNTTAVVNNQVFLAGYSIPLGTDWIAAHCNAVAYLYDKETLEVFQVAEVKLR